jgi:hypothetical protein
MALLLSAAFTLFVALAIQASAQGNGSHHSQNIQTNNGVAVQVNVQQSLQKAAAASMLDERGWMRVLTPAHDPTPRGCDQPNQVGSLKPNDFKIFYGGNVAICNFAQCNIVVAGTGVEDIPIISVQKIKSGFLFSARIYDKDGNILAKIDGDRLYRNKAFVSDFNRPDAHSVWIKDNHDREVLNVRLLNPTSLRIEGIFYVPYDPHQSNPYRPFITIKKDGLFYDFATRPEFGNCTTIYQEQLGAISFGYRNDR